MTTNDIDAIRNQASDLLVARAACVKNGACERCSARSRDLALAVPDVCFEVEQLRSDLDFARTEAKNIYDTLKTVERERDEARAALTEANRARTVAEAAHEALARDNAGYAAQVDEMRWQLYAQKPVIEAAEAWAELRDSEGITFADTRKADAALYDAIEQYRVMDLALTNARAEQAEVAP